MGLGQKVAPGVTPGRGRDQSRLLCRRSDLVTCMVDGPRADRKGRAGRRGVECFVRPCDQRFGRAGGLPGVRLAGCLHVLMVTDNLIVRTGGGP
jgi:hypothetical protein